MWRILPVVLTCAFLYASDNPWKKVQELKSGSELRIYKKGSRQPITATLYEATDERIIVLMKSEQSAIAKDDIDQIDARPPVKKMGKPTVQTTAKQTEPDYTPSPYNRVPVPGTAYGSNVEFSGKADLETIYRRTAPVAKPSIQTPKAMPPETLAPSPSPQ